MSKFKPIEYRGHNGYDTAKASSDACPSDNNDTYWGPSLTVQSQAEDADLNVIMERFGITGKMPENLKIPMYGDFTDNITDYKTALVAMRDAQELFMQIPAKVRSKFENNAATFMDWIHDPANLDEARTLGLAKALPPQPAAPTKTEDDKKPST